MATQTKPDTDSTTDPAAFEQAAQRIRDLNERLIDGGKSAGSTSLDAYETALKSLVDLETKVAAASRLGWVSSAATTHARFVQDVSAAYTKVARDMLS